MTADQRETRFARINRAALVLYLAGAGLVGVISARRGDWYALSQVALAIAMLPLAHLLFWLLRRKTPALYLTGDILLLYRLFSFGTVVVGSACYGYSRIPFWDKIFHSISGMLIAAAGLMVWRLLFPGRAQPEKPFLPLALLFTQCFNLSVAAFWEFYEYALLVFFNTDAVNHYTTGVHDTLQDMLVCTLGGLLFLLQAVRFFYRGRRSFLLNCYEHFFAMLKQQKNDAA